MMTNSPECECTCQTSDSSPDYDKVDQNPGSIVWLECNIRTWSSTTRKAGTYKEMHGDGKKERSKLKHLLSAVLVSEFAMLQNLLLTCIHPIFYLKHLLRLSVSSIHDHT